ncbi:hypothetical protein ACFOUP_18350 [Belliella kenyensis]|uniref:Mobilization protein n=1 Tax=Belliella kenyensis TaxID=1472724 RepID=A0ABV8ESN4_9BACT|nr:hypothetical protein [Belliella kenyensis]MCH7402258.1 hypothetical protein [Belliella kenyensis]MDN3601774.1 hypothetical protein [Belliella kenyensis]
MQENKSTNLPRRVESRISETKFQELLTLLSKSQNQTMSSLVRDILCKQKLVVTTYDKSLDVILEKLSLIHQEINAIGVNANQVVRVFHKTGDLSKKLALAKKLANNLNEILKKQESLKNMVSPLLDKWLQK